MKPSLASKAVSPCTLIVIGLVTSLRAKWSEPLGNVLPTKSKTSAPAVAAPVDDQFTSVATVRSPA